MASLIPVVEMFGPTIQGEGFFIGQPTVFLRVGGCDYACRWCDSMHAVDAKQYAKTWERLRADEIYERLWKIHAGRMKKISLTLSGGNPALYDLSPIILNWPGPVIVETQGTIEAQWFKDCNAITLSPKPPSSGHEGDLIKALAIADKYPRHCNFKFVADKILDIEWILDNVTKHIRTKEGKLRWPVCIQPCNVDLENDDIDDQRTLLAVMHEKVLNAVYASGQVDIRVTPQFHVWLWGNKKGV